MARTRLTEHMVDNDNGTRTGKTTAVMVTRPYIADVTIRGTTSLIMHRYDVDAVEAASKAAKGSRGKKTDDLESYVYRDSSGLIVIPALNFHACLNDTCKSRQDPRSPRKCMRDLMKAAIVISGPDDGEFCRLRDAAGNKPKTWDALDKRRAVVQRNGISRVRPIMLVGWTLEAVIDVLMPEYVPAEMLHEIIAEAGRHTGLADHRPQYGRFGVSSFKVRK